MSYRALYKRSIHERDAYWAEQATRIDWHRPFDKSAMSATRPFAKWFVGGQTNLCHNAVDRHVPDRADQPALIFVSTETNTEEHDQLWPVARRGQRMAAVLHGLGVGKGDRVLIYMPMIPQAVIAMLATVRLGPSTPSCSAALPRTRWPVASTMPPRVIVTADAGSRGGKVIPYKPLLDEALACPRTRCRTCCWSTASWPRRDGSPPVTWTTPARSSTSMDAIVPCEWVESTHPSYIAVHQRHHRQAQGRAARYRRLCRGPGRVDGAHLLRQAGRDLFFAPATSAGWWATATSSTARCSPA
jgi:propionyl-CoA synthetase